MLSLNYENINYVMTQILKLSYVGFSYVNISYVLAIVTRASARDYMIVRISYNIDVETFNLSQDKLKLQNYRWLQLVYLIPFIYIS